MTNLTSATVMEMKMDGTYVASVVLTGLAVVFLALLLLIGIFYLFGAVFNKKPKVKKAPPAAEKTISTEKTPIIKAEPMPVIENGIDDETVAVIAAAIAAMSAQTGKKLRLLSVGSAKNRRTAWAQAGLADNTRPF